MKRIAQYITILACALLFASCQKEFDGVFTAEIQNYQGTNGKVYINGEDYACWNNGDQISLSKNGVKSEKGSNVSISGNTATIETEGFVENDDISAVYPDFGTALNQLTIASEQKYKVSGSHQVIKAPMVARATVGKGNKLIFYNAAALMKVVVKNNKSSNITISKIQLSDNQGEKLSGEVSYTQSVESAPQVTSDALNGANITLQVKNTEHNSVVTISSGESATFYIYVAPNVSRQYKVSIIGGNGKMLTSKIAKKSIAIKQNQMATMTLNIGGSGNGNGFSGGTGTSTDPYILSTSEDFKNLHDNTASYAGKYFTQSNDIEVPSDWTSITGFSGHYNGGGHVIKCSGGWGIFQTLNNGAVLENMIVEVNINGESNIVSGLVRMISSGTITIKNCKARGTITNGSPASGICGKISGGNVAIENCVNEVNFTVNNNSSQYGFGGICGDIQNATCTIINCANHGNINSSVNSGGIVGHIFNSYVYINNSYSNCMMQSTVNGIIGSLSIATVNGQPKGKCELNNVYAGGTLASGKWIVNNNTNTNCSITNVYSPSNVDDKNGCAGVTSYDSNWKVDGTLLVDELNTKRTTTEWSKWIPVSNSDNRPTFSFAK